MGRKENGEGSTEERLNSSMDGWMNEYCMDERMNTDVGWMDKWVSVRVGWLVGSIDVWVERLIGRQGDVCMG